MKIKNKGKKKKLLFRLAVLMAPYRDGYSKRKEKYGKTQEIYTLIRRGLK